MASLAALHTTTVHGNVWDASHTTAKNKIGARLAMADGRVWRYGYVASTTVAAGDVLAAAPDGFDIAATYFGVDTSTAPAVGEGGAVGDKKIRHCVVTGTATMTAGEYEGGYLCITDGTGEGYIYSIDHHGANAATGSTVLYINEEVVVALDNTSVGALVKSPWKDCVVATAKDAGGDPDEMVCGVASVAASAAGYQWVQTWGPAPVQAGAATIKAGSVIVLAEDDNGSAQIPVAGENIIHPFGVGMDDTADTIFGVCYLTIAP